MVKTGRSVIVEFTDLPESGKSTLEVVPWCSNQDVSC